MTYDWVISQMWKQPPLRCRAISTRLHSQFLTAVTKQEECSYLTGRHSSNLQTKTWWYLYFHHHGYLMSTTFQKYSWDNSFTLSSWSQDWSWLRTISEILSQFLMEELRQWTSCRSDVTVLCEHENNLKVQRRPGKTAPTKWYTCHCSSLPLHLSGPPIPQSHICNSSICL